MTLIKKLFKENKIFFFNYNHNSFFEGLYRFFGILISPLFIKLSPNLISFLSLFCGFIGLIFSVSSSIKINFIIFFFLLSFVLDFTDGMIARFTNKTSFYGRFIDGLFDIIVIGFLHIVFLIHLINIEVVEIKNIYFTCFLVSLTLLPIQHLILDRFSSIARWCKEINNNKDIKPYHRNTFFGKITKLLFDLQHLCIWISIFINNDNYFVVIIFFILSIFSSILNLIIYIYLSKKNFSKVKNTLDND